MVARTNDGRFKPGQCGNPRGRPKGRTTREIVRAALTEDGGKGLRDWVADLLATRGDPKAAAVLLDVLSWLDGREPAPEPSGARDDAPHEGRMLDVRSRLLRGVDVDGLG